MYEALINKYCSESGQEVNKNKSILYFSSNMDFKIKCDIMKLFGIKQISTTNKYLGVNINFKKKKEVQILMDWKKAFCESIKLERRLLNQEEKWIIIK